MPTLIQQTWFELDKVMATAIEWPGEGKNVEPTPGSIEEWCDYLENRVDYVGQTSIGRGLAIAIKIACEPFFENADQVVALAVQRYQAKMAGQPMPETPGFMGEGQTGDALRVAATGKSPENSDTPAGQSRRIGLDDDKPKKSPAPAKKPDSGLDKSQVDFIKMSAQSGFTAQQIAETVRVDVSVIEAVLA